MVQVKKMNNLKVGETGKVKKIEGDDSLRRRLLDMGIIPGAKVEIIKIAPLGDPVEIKVRGYHLTLRKEEALQISLEVIEDV